MLGGLEGRSMASKVFSRRVYRDGECRGTTPDEVRWRLSGCSDHDVSLVPLHVDECVEGQELDLKVGMTANEGRDRAVNEAGERGW
jgi:hypothetical protein